MVSNDSIQWIPVTQDILAQNLGDDIATLKFRMLKQSNLLIYVCVFLLH